MAKIRIVGDSSGYVELAAPNAAGNNTLELPSNATKLVGADASNSLNVTGIVTATTISVGSGTSISSPATNVLTLGTNNTEVVRIDSSGNLGIGTTNPLTKVHVQGTGNGSTGATGLSDSSAASALLLRPTINSFTALALGTRNTGGHYIQGLYAASPTVSVRDVQINPYGGSVGIGTFADAFGGAPGNSTFVVGTTGVERLRIDSSGKTGINNTNPLSTLSVGTRTSDVSDTSLIFTAGGSSSGGEVLAATFCNTASGATNNSTAISFTCRSGDSQTAKIVAKQPSGASSPNTQLEFYVYGNSGSTKVVTFDQNGRVTTPYQPRFFAKCNSSSYVTTSPIQFTSVDFNVGSGYDSSTYKFTAPVAGIYYFVSTTYVNAGNTVNDGGYIRFRVNGSLSQYSYAGPGSSTSPNGHITLTLTKIVQLNANDYIDVTFSLYGTGSYYAGPAETTFGGYLMG